MTYYSMHLSMTHVKVYLMCYTYMHIHMCCLVWLEAAFVEAQTQHYYIVPAVSFKPSMLVHTPFVEDCSNMLVLIDCRRPVLTCRCAFLPDVTF